MKMTCVHKMFSCGLVAVAVLASAASAEDTTTKSAPDAGQVKNPRKIHLVFASASGVAVGLRVSEAPSVLSAQLGLDQGVGLVVDDLLTGSPADLAKLERHDLLVAVNGKTMKGKGALSGALADHKPGDVVTFTFLRTGKEQTRQVKLARSGDLVTSENHKSVKWKHGSPTTRTFQFKAGVLHHDEDLDVKLGGDQPKQSPRMYLWEIDGQSPADLDYQVGDDGTTKVQVENVDVVKRKAAESKQ